MKPIKLIFALVLGLATLSGCGTSETPSFDPDSQLDRQHMFFDDFNQGVDFNSWQVTKDKWGVGNGGVIPENVNYTEDGVLVLQANGDLYDGPFKGVGNDHGRRTGAKIETREPFGPGRYEVRMKAMPRFGATTAIWTYEYVNGLNQEIDIELNVENNFKTAWFTNWITLDQKVSKPVDTGIIHNDGEWHVYKFEWHTNPMRVDYYIDDILFQTANAYVPTYASRFNIGIWFPDSWAGTPDFETDYMYIDWVKITPYLNNDYIDTTDSLPASPSSYYPTAPIDYPQPNLISNPGFEGVDAAWRRSGNSTIEIEEGLGYHGTKGIYIPENEITYQYITGLDETFELTLRSRVKHSGANGQVLLEFYPLETSKIGETSMTISSSDEGYVVDDYYVKEYIFTLPAGTRRIELSLFSLSGALYMDDLFLNLSSKTPPLEEYLESENGAVVPGSFFDGFSQGVSSQHWQIANQVWGTNNGGVIYQNVNYLNEGTLVLTANGDYYQGNKLGINAVDGKRTGGAIISRDTFGPGRFEVRAKAMPRFGATSAFWTYYYTNGQNHEIDIELNVNNDFKRAWFTNWITEPDHESKKMDTDVLHNDGKYHTYRFDWYTGDNPRVDYFIDGKLYHTSTQFVPTHAMHMWIGVWFPNGWAGTPNFETDHMYVDYFRYVPFSGQSYVQTPAKVASPNAYYPQAPLDDEPANLISNPRDGQGPAWSRVGTVTNEEDGITITNGSATQTISGMREGMNLRFSGQLLNGATVKVSYLDSSNLLISSMNITSNTVTFTLPTGTRSMVVSLETNGSYRQLFMNLEARL